jgi:hypothetical protein
VVTSIDWCLRATKHGTMPPWKGSTLRGAIGWALARVAAGAPAPLWPGLASHTTFCDALFAPQTAWADQQAGTAWHLQCADTQTTMVVGSTLSGRFLCFGEWPAWLMGIWMEVFYDAVAHGFGVHAPSFEVAHCAVRPESWLPIPTNPTSCTITTLTSCRLQDRGQECTQLSAPAIARSVLRRWRQTHRQLLGCEPLLSSSYPELSAACDALTSNDAATPTTIARWSNRQHRAIDMPGLTGTITITGPILPILAPILAQAPLLHIGKQPNFGLGQVDVAWTNELKSVEIL